MNYNVDKLLELSKTCRQIGYTLTNKRYAGEMKDERLALYKDGFTVLTYPKVERTITIHGDEIENAAISVDYNLPDFSMHNSEDIETSNLIAIHEKDIPKYFEITDTTITHYTSKGTITEKIKHEDTIHYKNGFYLENLTEGLKRMKESK